MTNTITVIKQNPAGQETWRYEGRVLARRDGEIVIEAFFDQEDINIRGLWLRHGDRFVETYYADDRWYNILAVHSREDGHLKGWYCNIATPAEISEQCIAYRDLGLDLLIFPDGRQIVLDEDEFAAAEMPMAWRLQAQQALAELQTRFAAIPSGPQK